MAQVTRTFLKGETLYSLSTIVAWIVSVRLSGTKVDFGMVQHMLVHGSRADMSDQDFA